MSNQHSPQSKPSSQSGIRPPNLQEFTQRFEVLEKLVKDNLDEKNQWSSKVREWIEKPIMIQLVDSQEIFGILKWVDRYTVCLQEKPSIDVTIVHKGAIAVIRRQA
jgi:sulfur relay (sulfurtransferase) DsrC/TusE family protein